MSRAAIDLPVLPPLYELRGASRAKLQDCLDAVEQLDRAGLRPPVGYLFALSEEIRRFQDQAPVRQLMGALLADERQRQTRQISLAQETILRDWWNCAKGRAWREEDMDQLEFLPCEEGVLVASRSGETMRVLFQDGAEVCCIEGRELQG